MAMLTASPVAQPSPWVASFQAGSGIKPGDSTIPTIPVGEPKPN
jgi:hypothetical protein